MIKPIETIYNGYKFRSRLEARWAIFFDELGIKYEYEPEGYELSSYEKYLPDFFLPDFNGGMFCEVKPSGGDFSKAMRFSKDGGVSLWLCEGTPDFAIYKYTDDGEDVFCGLPNFSSAHKENRMYAMPCGEFDNICNMTNCFDLKPILLPKGEHGVDLNRYFDDIYINAIAASRQARFEHGEKP